MRDHLIWNQTSSNLIRFDVMDTSNIQEHMEVISLDGQHVGTVDHLDGDRIKLTRTDPAAGGVHHYVAVSNIDHVDAHVHLNVSSADLQLTTE